MCVHQYQISEMYDILLFMLQNETDHGDTNICNRKHLQSHIHTHTHTNTQTRIHTNTHTHNCFTALLDFVQEYLGEPAPER